MRLDVTMNHALVVSVLQPQSRLSDVVARFVDWQLTASRHDGSQVRPFHKLHREEMYVAGLLCIVSRHDVGMSKLSRSLHLAPKSLNRLRVPDQLRVDQLQRDRPVHQPMLSTINRPHAALADLINDLVARMILQFGRQFRHLDEGPGLHQHRGCMVRLNSGGFVCRVAGR